MDTATEKEPSKEKGTNNTYEEEKMSQDARSKI